VKILALDTTSEFGSLALAEGDRIVEAAEVYSPDGFGHVIFQEVLSLLGRQGWKLESIDCYAAASGPGSFTGVRVGLTAVKGLAEAQGKRVVAVSNLLALAYAGEGDWRATLIDARRGEIYGAVYDASLRPVVDEMVVSLPRFLEALGEREVTFVATDFIPFQAGLRGTRFEGSRVVTVRRALAGPIAGLAARAFAEGRALLPEQVEANYVRRSDAELKWKGE